MSGRLTLCICTMNRPDELRKCLQSLSTSGSRPHQVIVSDDSKESLAPQVQAVAGEFEGVDYIRGPRRGLSANRNSCLRRATGDLIAFVDDDVELHPEFIGRGVREHAELVSKQGDSRVIVTGNEIRPDGRYDPSKLSFLGFYSGRLAHGEMPGAICINSTVFPMALFKRIEFDENIVFGSEERDISLHARHLGYSIFFCPELTNYHYPSPVNRDIYNRVEVTSRIYFGLKRYWIYERSVSRFLLFNVYAIANAVGNRLKRGRIRESAEAVGAFFRAWGRFLSRSPVRPACP